MTLRLTRRSLARPLLVASSVAILAVGSVSGPVVGHDPNPILGGGTWPKDTTLTFRWRAGEVPPAAMQTAIKAAAADSNGSKASRAVTYAYASNGSNPIEYGLGVTCGVNGLACFTRTVGSGFTMGFREHGHRFDWGSLRWCQMLSTPTNGCYDVENIALDEFGHIQGLGHHVNYGDDRDYADSVVQTYARTRPSKGWNAHAYGRCDVAALQTLYDVTSSMTKISTCLDLPTTLAFTTTSPAVGPYRVVPFTATLRVATGSAYGQLSGNALSSRTVVLQRRPYGATSWATVATMTAGPLGGTYVASVSPTTTDEWRASFTASSAEGLRSSSSASMWIGVGEACKGVALALAAPCL